MPQLPLSSIDIEHVVAVGEYCTVPDGTSAVLLWGAGGTGMHDLHEGELAVKHAPHLVDEQPTLVDEHVAAHDNTMLRRYCTAE